MNRRIAAALGCMLVLVVRQGAAGQTTWQTHTIDFAGPAAQETNGAFNPFMDRRLDVTFTGPSGQVYVVPGYYAADGNAATTHATSGNVWRVNFTPDEAGVWSYTTSFRQGADVAVAADPLAGNADATIDGRSGSFNVAPRDPNAPGFLSKGRLVYAGNHYLKTLGDNKHWIKGGADSPENFLGYLGFDNTTSLNNRGPDYTGTDLGGQTYGRLHQYPTHRADWNAGDPDWTRDPADNVPGTTGPRDGRNLIGVLNYLGSQGVNSIYFLPMNLGGDGQDTHPFVAPNGSSDKLYDVSKLDQWELAFSHAQEQGINLNVVLNEAETNNKNFLDNGTLGTERKLFYREMIARFGHHNALQWMISEEYNRDKELSPDTIREFAAFIDSIDPYDHPTSVHNGNFGNWPTGTNFPSQHVLGDADPTNDGFTGLRAEWEPFMGDPLFDLTSYQNYNERGIGDEVEFLRQRSADKGRPIAVMIDEPESLDALSADNVRREMIWDIYLSGGGVEWFVRNQDQSLENFRQFEQVWQETTAARRFLENHLPFWQMNPADDLLTGEDAGFGGGEVFALLGEVYAIYLPETDHQATGALNLSDHDTTFIFQWIDPTTGELIGESIELLGGGIVDLPDTPGLNASGENDWVALVTVVPEPTGAAGIVLPMLLVGAGRGRTHHHTPLHPSTCPPTL